MQGKPMKTPQVPPMPGMSPLGLRINPKNVDEKTVAERQWRKPLLPGAAQQSCDFGLFGDGHKQTDLIDRLNREEQS
jgi:hypothetical protein